MDATPEFVNNVDYVPDVDNLGRVKRERDVLVDYVVTT